MNILLHDNHKHLRFAPLTLMRPIGNLRMGMFTNDERWKFYLPEAHIGYETADYLQTKFRSVHEEISVNACVIPNADIAEAIRTLKPQEELTFEGTWIARHGGGDVLVPYKGKAPVILHQRWDLYQKNGEVLQQDFDDYTLHRTTQPLSSTNTVIGNPKHVFLEAGAVVEAAILNTLSGPIYIGKHAEIMEGSIVRGGLAMAEGSALKLGTKIYGATSLGPHCKIGGEVNNCIFQGYSNKGHDGFLGNSLIGEWCNLGADTNTSNLKNNYGTVRTYSFESEKMEETGVQFMGLVMGDHSRAGINTMFNTATVTGVFANVFGADFPPKYIPSFSWGMHGEHFNEEKAIESANAMMERRGLALTDDEIAILRFLAAKK